MRGGCRHPVGSAASAVRNRMGRIVNADTHHRTAPADEWFNGVLSKTDKTEMMNDFASSVRVHLDAMHELGQVADEVMTIAIDMHLIPRWDKKPGTDLTRSRRKNGTGTFEGYITAQCVDGGPRPVLSPAHGSLGTCRILCATYLQYAASGAAASGPFCLIVSSFPHASLEPWENGCGLSCRA